MIVVDANVVLSALRSSKGASHLLLREMLVGNVPFAVSPAVALEYEDVLKSEKVFWVMSRGCARTRLKLCWMRFSARLILFPHGFVSGRS
jgi:predicted nucleic acid-binding protein